MVRPAALSRLRRLWDGSEGKMRAVEASLHYVVASMDGSNWMLWGRFPGKRLAPSIHSYSAPHKVSEQFVVCVLRAVSPYSFLYLEGRKWHAARH